MRWFPLLVAAACAPSEPAVFDVDAQPFDEAIANAEGTDVVAPRGPLTLVADPLVQGQPAILQVFGLVPGELAYVAFSVHGTGQGPCPPAMGGQCLDLVPPALLVGSTRADGSGIATLLAPVPQNAPVGVPVSLQAVAIRGAGGAQTVTSTPVTERVEAPFQAHSGGGPSPYVDIRFVTWKFQFGYDRAANQAISVNVPGAGAVAPSLDITLATPDWQADGFDASATQDYCTVSLDLTTSPVPGWVAADPTLWFGVDASATGTTDCNRAGFALDPGLWGADPVRALGSLGTWGAAIGDTSAAVQQDFLPYVPAAQQPYWFGGAMQVPLLYPTLTDTIATEAVAIDPATHDVLVNGGSTVPLTAAQVDLPGAPAPAWYRGGDIYVYYIN